MVAASHPRSVCVTVDLDPLPAYYEIHGLPDPGSDPAARHCITRAALPRLLDLFDELDARATLFVVGQDLNDLDVRGMLGAAARAGHELGNHTERHPYRFLDVDGPGRLHEIRACHDRIASLTGRAPVGFRAPGYHADAELLHQLLGLGYRYDSSLLPSAPYWLAKATVMTLLRLRRRPSRARLHPPTDLVAPRTPYRPAARAPWRRGVLPLWEVPAASLVAGLPLVGTFLADLPPPHARWLGQRLRSRPFVTVELHGIDLADLHDGDLEALLGRQPGLARPLRARRAALAAFLGALCPGARVIPLGEALPVL